MPLPVVRVAILFAALLLPLASGTARSRAADMVGGAVTDASGRPVSSAHVQLWDGDRMLASAWTDREGTFRISTTRSWTPAWRLRVERLGYEPADVPVPEAALTVAVVVEPAPLPLPGLRIEAEVDLCSAPDQPAARALLEGASRLHQSGLDTLAIATYTEEWTDTIASEPAGPDRTSEGLIGQRSSAPLLRLSWNRRIERDGYAFRVRRSDSERSYDSWSYAPLEADLAPHFLSEAFEERHRFRVETADGAGWILRFCGTEREDPYLTGLLELGPDTLVARAEWEFHTPEPDESAGGWAGFDTRDDGFGRPLLLPRESFIWRTLPDGGTIRRAQSYEGWITAQGDSVPFLPARTTPPG